MSQSNTEEVKGQPNQPITLEQKLQQLIKLANEKQSKVVAYTTELDNLKDDLIKNQGKIINAKQEHMNAMMELYQLEQGRLSQIIESLRSEQKK